VPVVDEAAVRAFLDEALTLVPDHLKPARLATERVGDVHPAHAQAGTLTAIRKALAWILNADVGYDSWARLGLALKGALGEAGADLFAAWSAQSGKDDAASTAKTWAGLKAERIGAGTIYHLAMERGWKPDPALVLDGATSYDVVHPAAGLLARVRVGEPTPAAPAPQTSLELRVPEGILTEMVDYMVSTARRLQPLLSLGASLCALGALMGRKYRTETNLRSNLYVVGIADSGSGKRGHRTVRICGAKAPGAPTLFRFPSAACAGRFRRSGSWSGRRRRHHHDRRLPRQSAHAGNELPPRAHREPVHPDDDRRAHLPQQRDNFGQAAQQVLPRVRTHIAASQMRIAAS
jgi:hypothetical protein